MWLLTTGWGGPRKYRRDRLRFRRAPSPDAPNPRRLLVPQRILEGSADVYRRLNTLSLRLFGLVARVRPDERRDALGANHPDYRRTLDNLAELHLTLADNQVQPAPKARVSARLPAPPVRPTPIRASFIIWNIYFKP